jgi:DnaJ like chaperone protein
MSPNWFGKAVGAALGFAVGGPPGLVLGALLGHQFDQGAQTGFSRRRGSAQTQKLFFEVTFEVMGHLAKIDGRVTEEEIRIARRIMHRMRLDPEQVQVAIERFSAGKKSGYPLDSRLHALEGRIGRRKDLVRAFIEIQLQAAIGGGEIAQAKRLGLWDIARTFDVGRAELAQFESLVRAQMNQTSARSGSQGDLALAYRALGVAANASDGEVKTAYRRLMNRHHPDKLVSKGLPQSMVAIAEQKTHEIRTAYERIKVQRGFK